MIKRAKNLTKRTFTDIEVAKIHNRYRLVMIIMVVGFMWVSWRFGIMDDIARVFGITIDPKKGFSYFDTKLSK